MKVMVLPTVICALGTIPKGLINHPNNNIYKINQNNEKSFGDLRKLAATQTPSEEPSSNAYVKNSQRVK